jgi:hypothetical protein
LIRGEKRPGPFEKGEKRPGPLEKGEKMLRAPSNHIFCLFHGDSQGT